jgi:hypothetical protein
MQKQKTSKSAWNHEMVFCPDNPFFYGLCDAYHSFFQWHPQSTLLSQKLKIKTRTLNDNQSDVLHNALAEHRLISVAIHLLNAATWNQDAL